MTLSEIASFLNKSSNNQLSPGELCLIMDSIQKKIFQSNTAAFLQYSQVLTLYQNIQMIAAGYTGCVPSDIGMLVSDSASGSGMLMAYDNTLMIWTIGNITSPFITPGPIAVTSGTGSAQSTTPLSITGYEGPYAAPTNPTCRKVWGITQRKPQKFWLDFIVGCGLYWINGLPNTQDYMAFWGANAPFETGLNDDLQNTFLFSFCPSLQATYYWVYWRNPPSITGFNDNTQLIIPEAYHHDFFLACRDLGSAIVEGGAFNDQAIENYLGGWIDSLRAPFRDQKLNRNMSQAPNGIGYMGSMSALGGGGWI